METNLKAAKALGNLQNQYTNPTNNPRILEFCERGGMRREKRGREGLATALVKRYADFNE